MPNSTDLDQKLVEDLCDRLGIAADSVTIYPLSGGLLRRSYRFLSEAGDWAVRLPGSADDRHRLELSAERKLLETLSAAGLTAPIVSQEAGDLLVTRYLADAETWTDAAARAPENITRVAEQLRDMHQIDHDLPPYSATRVAEDYVRSADELHRLSAEQRDWMQQFLSLARAYDAASTPTTLCHHDLVAENILDDGQLWLIDFEYAVCAEPLLDLASLASMNDFSTAQQDCLLDAYYQGATPPFSTARFTEVIRLLRLLSYFWALASHGPDHMDSNVDRFVANMAAVLR